MRAHYLSKRETQIMDIVHGQGEATAAEIEAALPNAPSNGAVRTMLRILEKKGHLQHREEGGRYIYQATRPRETEGRSALKAVMTTFFGGSISSVVSTLLDAERDRLSDEEFAELTAMIARAREEGR